MPVVAQTDYNLGRPAQPVTAHKGYNPPSKTQDIVKQNTDTSEKKSKLGEFKEEFFQNGNQTRT